MKVNTEHWSEFHIADLFEVKKGTRLTRANMIEGDTPFVGACITNNGVNMHVGNIEHVHPGNVISVAYNGAVATGRAFYQAEPFWASDDVAVLYPRFELNQLRALFFIPLIESAGKRYAFEDKWKKSDMEQAVIRVPARNGIPDWLWIDDFEASIERRASDTLAHAITASANKSSFANLEGWRCFAIGDLFDIMKGTRLTKAEMRDGDIRFIGSSAMNNGVTRLIANDEHLHPAGVLTVCYNGSVGETFYQDERFWASDDVNVLYPKFDMDFQLAMFIAPLIKQRSKCYSYIDKWKLADMTNDEIPLPVDDKGSPDWETMREFAAKRIAHSTAVFDSLAASK